MLLCVRLRWWHGASFPNYIGSPVLLGLLEISDWQLVQALMEAGLLVSTQASLRHLQLVPMSDSSVRSSGRLLVATRLLGNCH